MKKYVLATLLFAISNWCFAQERTLINEFVLWTQVSQKIRLSDDYTASLAAQYRAFTDRDEDYHLFFSGLLTRKIAKGFSVSVGFMNLNINRLVDSAYVLVPELRPVQSVQFTYPVNRSSFFWRLMTEQRFFRNAADGKLVDGYSHNWRFRNRFGIAQYLSENWRLMLSSEVMINAGDININIFDQHRTQALLSYRTGNWTVESGYMHWFFQTAANRHENRHTWVFGLTHSL